MPDADITAAAAALKTIYEGIKSRRDETGWRPDEAKPLRVTRATNGFAMTFSMTRDYNSSMQVGPFCVDLAGRPAVLSTVGDGYAETTQELGNWNDPFLDAVRALEQVTSAVIVPAINRQYGDRELGS